MFNLYCIALLETLRWRLQHQNCWICKVPWKSVQGTVVDMESFFQVLFLYGHEGEPQIANLTAIAFFLRIAAFSESAWDCLSLCPRDAAPDPKRRDAFLKRRIYMDVMCVKRIATFDLHTEITSWNKVKKLRPANNLENKVLARHQIPTLHQQQIQQFCQ